MHQQSKLNSWIDCTSSAVAFAQALALFSLLAGIFPLLLLSFFIVMHMIISSFFD